MEVKYWGDLNIVVVNFSGGAKCWGDLNIAEVVDFPGGVKCWGGFVHCKGS